MKTTKLFIIFTLFTLNFSLATVINVPADQPTIQDGINTAVEGDTVLVAAGTYYENIIWPNVYGIQLIGSSAENCIIDGNQNGSVIWIERGVPGCDTTTVIKNFTLQRGRSYKGAGLYIQFSNRMLLENLIIKDNLQEDVWDADRYNEPGGGAIQLDVNSSPIIRNVLITGNEAQYRGGGMYLYNGSDPTLENVAIIGNSALADGGGICCSGSSPSLKNVTIAHNISHADGGGICSFGTPPTFSSEVRCNIYSNNTSNRGSGADIFAAHPITVVVDTFTVMTPTEYYASPLENFTFDILHSIIPEEEQINADVFVSPEGNNNNDGLSAESPFKTIQHAMAVILADSTNPHTIYLADGVYSSSTNGEFFPINAISFVSFVGESEDGVILDAEGAGSVMRFVSVDQATVSNLTLQGGNVPDIFYSIGSGVYIEESSPNFQNVTITENSGNSGGGVSCWDSSPRFENVTISNNEASERGGGMFFYRSGAILTKVLICDNYAIVGGGLYNWNCSPNIEEVTIVGNVAGMKGGGVYFDDSNSTLTNVTISKNFADDDGAGIYGRQGSHIKLVNCILWDDEPQEISFSSVYYFNSIGIYYSDIQGGEDNIEANDNAAVNWHSSNIDADPLFVNTEIGDFQLTEFSPCIDAGTAFFVLSGDTLVNMSENEYIGYAPDMGAFEWEENLNNNDELEITNYELMSAFPNPFNPITTIEYDIPKDGHITLTIYDIMGRKVKELVNKHVSIGTHTIIWNGTNQYGDRTPSGMYFYHLKADDYVETRKLILLK